MRRAPALAQSELIVIVFDQQEDAFWARCALESMRTQHLFGLEYAAEITRDNAGQTVLHHYMALPVYPHASHTRMPSLLSNAIFSPSAKDKQLKLAEAGLDEFFVEAVTDALAPDCSALLIFIPYTEHRIDLPALLKALA